MGWRDVIGGPDPDDGPAAHHARCLALLRDAPAILSEWERGFLVGLLRFGKLTPKQRARLGEVSRKVEAVRGMAGDA